MHDILHDCFNFYKCLPVSKKQQNVKYIIYSMQKKAIYQFCEYFFLQTKYRKTYIFLFKYITFVQLLDDNNKPKQNTILFSVYLTSKIHSKPNMKYIFLQNCYPTLLQTKGFLNMQSTQTVFFSLPCIIYFCFSYTTQNYSINIHIILS